MALADFSGVIPPEYSNQIIQQARRQSAALALGSTIPMGTNVSQMPVPKTFPTASWVTSATGRKPYTDIGLQPATLTAEEVAAVVAVPDRMIEDSSINLWGYVRPLLAEAIAVAVDGAMLYGVNAPASFPTGGVRAEAVAVNAGTDAVDTLNKTMAQVEGQGLTVTGHAADITTRSLFRGVRATTGELILGTTQVDGAEVPALYGSQVTYTPFQNKTGINPATLISGNWANLIVGVRQDIRYQLDPSGVIADAAGVVVVSGFQDNVTPLKVWARFGCVILRPATSFIPAGARAFAKSAVAATSGTAPTAAEDSEEPPARSTAKR